MPEAFEVYAFDYLVKPFKLQRLGQTLERIKGISSLRQDVSENKVIRSANVPRKLIIRNKESISFVDMEEIILVQREDRATAIYTVQDRFVTSDNLGDVEQKLDESMFIRCHKSYIININYIDKIYPYGRWTYIVKLKGTDRDALMTRESFDRLENILE